MHRPDLFVSRAADVLLAESAPGIAGTAEPIQFEQETLRNGLRVIYAPLRQAPVVHVRVIYHVGSKDEPPDRRGIAHLFEHMMFRGSQHVQPEEHMRLVGIVGGRANAYTGVDETVYYNTVPANQLELVLYLEADRMAGFRVSQAILDTERKVIAEEWRTRQNQPYGMMYDEFLRAAYTCHGYRSTPIGDMNHLRAASVKELQAFFHAWYVPNNAILVITGDIEIHAARRLVHRYFSWVPPGDPIVRHVMPEPPQVRPRRVEMLQHVPAGVVLLGYRIPAYTHEDHYPLSLLTSILGRGRSSRLERELVYGERPSCMSTVSTHNQWQDPSILMVAGMVLEGHDADGVEARLLAILDGLCRHGVTGEELERARTQQRMTTLLGRETAASLAAQLGREALFGGDADRVNDDLRRIEAVTPEAIQAVARRYLRADNRVTLRIVPSAAEQVALPLALHQAPAAEEPPALLPPVCRCAFPVDHPRVPPVRRGQIAATFRRGVETRMRGVRVIVIQDRRLPLVTWSLTIRGGSHADPPGKEGLGELTATLLRRGVAGMSFSELNDDLENRGIILAVRDSGDTTWLTGSCASDQLGHAMYRMRQLLLEPTFPADELERLKALSISRLHVAQEAPESVATAELHAALFGRTPLGRFATPETLAAITREQVEEYHRRIYRPDGAILVISGDVGPEQGRALAAQLLDGWAPGRPIPVDYPLPEPARSRRIILVDRPEARQALIRMGIRAYTRRFQAKFAGAIASAILTAGIDARLGRYVRAIRGLAYSVYGHFQPGRHAGAFLAGTDTSITSAAEAIQAMFEVFEAMRAAPVSDDELAEAKTRVIGGLVMGMQTPAQQASYRIEGILNGYPVDYYDRYAGRIVAVTAAQVRDVMRRYVRPDRMAIVVVAPAEAVRAQLEPFGQVEVVPMPAQRVAPSAP